MNAIDIGIILYCLGGALYSHSWYKQQEDMQLPIWRFCLQIVIAVTGWPWLLATEWNMAEAFSRFMDEHDEALLEETDELTKNMRNGNMVELNPEQADKFQAFMEELMSEDSGDKPLTDDKEDL